MKCARCNRTLRREPVLGEYGPRCAAILFGSKPRRFKREDRKSALDERQCELDLRYADTARGVRVA